MYTRNSVFNPRTLSYSERSSDFNLSVLHLLTFLLDIIVAIGGSQPPESLAARARSEYIAPMLADVRLPESFLGQKFSAAPAAI